MAGLSRHADAIPIASVPTRSGLASSTLILGALLASIGQGTRRRISEYYFLIKLWIAPRRCTHPPGDRIQQSNLTQSITKNRPFLTRLVGDPFGKEAVWEATIRR